MNRGATTRLRFDRQISSHESDPFFHADEAHPPARPGGLDVKSRSMILHQEMKLTLCFPELHLELPVPAVFRRIVEGFLQNPEEAQRNV